MPRNPIDKRNEDCAFHLGTTASGNLPQYKVSDNICEVNLEIIQLDFPNLKASNFHAYHLKCPFSTQSDYNFYRDIDRTSPTYWKMIAVSSTADHAATKGVMIRESRGARRHGWLCVDNSCPYYINTGQRYFYI